MRTLASKFYKSQPLWLPHEWVWNWKLWRGQIEPFGGRFSWLKNFVEEAAQLRSQNSNSRRLLIVSDYTHWLAYCGALAALDYAQGHNVCLVHSLYSGWGVGRDRSSHFPEWSGKIEDPRLELKDFRSIPLDNLTAAADTPELIELAEKQARSDTQNLTMSEEIDLTDGSADRTIWEARRRHNLNFARRFVPLLQSGEFDRVIMPNGALMEFGVGYELCRRHNMPCTTFEFTGYDEVVMVSDDAPIMDLQSDHLWAAAQADGLTAERRARAEKIVSERKRDWAVPDSKADVGQRKESGRELVTGLGLDPAKPVALLCANVVGDSIMLGRGTAFPTMTDWVQATLDYFKSRPDVQLVVRVHPAEAIWKPRLPVGEIVRKRLGTLPPNIRLVDASEEVSTYQLIGMADVGLVFNSTVGIEMAAMGRPTITAGRAHYSHKGFTDDPQDADAYFRILAGYLTRPDRREDPASREVALLYVDVFFHDMPVPFPWQLYDFDASLTKWPLQRLLSPAGIRQYALGLQVMAGSRDPRRRHQ